VGTCLGSGLSSRQRKVFGQRLAHYQLGCLFGASMNIGTSAVTKLKELIAEENNPNLKLRVFVQGGGCSGFSYGFTFDEDQNDDDFEFERESVKILVDSMSFQYLDGAEIDFKEDIRGSSFVINNPNASSTCGCGSSFSI
jgi:iron-sulfur cluster insertion protein